MNKLNKQNGSVAIRQWRIEIESETASEYAYCICVFGGYYFTHSSIIAGVVIACMPSGRNARLWYKLA